MAFLRRKPDHALLTYRQAEECADRVADFLRAGMQKGGCAIVIAIPEHADALQGRLGSMPVHWRDARDVLRRILRDGRPVPALFDEVVGRQVREAAEQGPVYLFGEMVAVLCNEGQFTAAIELEALWNRLLREIEAPLLCAYPASVFSDPAHAHHLRALRKATPVDPRVGPRYAQAHATRNHASPVGTAGFEPA